MNTRQFHVKTLLFDLKSEVLMFSQGATCHPWLLNLSWGDENTTHVIVGLPSGKLT